MREAHGSGVTSLGPPTQLLWVHQPRRRRYRRSATSATRGGHPYLAGLEQRRDYQRLLARLVRLSERFQRSLTAEQRGIWLALEDALLDHAWFLQGYYFRAGYELGKSKTQRRLPGDRPTDKTVNDLREQALLLAAFAKLLGKVVDAGR